MKLAGVICLICFIFHVTLITATSSTSTSAEILKFYTDIIDNGNVYNKEVFPRTNQDGLIVVDLKFSLYSIKNFDEVAGTLELVGKLSIEWTDEIIGTNYNAGNHGTFTALDFSKTKVWIPTVTVFNSVSKIKPVGELSNRVRYTRSSGKMEWGPGIVTKTGCNVDASNFPFDVQTCKITFTIWGYSATEVKFTPTSNQVDLTLFNPNEQWDVTETTMLTETIDGGSYVHYELTLARRSLYFVANLLFPILVLSILNAIVFLLPPATGERISYSVTAFLSFAVYLTLTSEILPRVSEPMSILSVYLMMMVCVSAGTALFTIFSLRIFHKDEEEMVPDKVATLVACLNCKICKDEDDDDDMDMFLEDKAEDTKQPLQETDEPLNDAEAEKAAEAGLILPAKDDDDKVVKGKYGVDWKLVSATLDFFFFIIFCGLSGCLSFFFLVPLAVQI